MAQDRTPVRFFGVCKYVLVCFLSVGGLVFWETCLCVCRVVGRPGAAALPALRSSGQDTSEPTQLPRTWSPAAVGFPLTITDDSAANSDT